MSKLTATAVLLLLVAGCSSNAPPESSSSPQPAALSETVATPTSPAPTTDSAVPSPTKASPKPKVPRVGETQRTDLGRIKVFKVKYPVEPQDPTANDIATRGTKFAVADIKVCGNGSSTSDGYWFGPDMFQLTDGSGRNYTFWNVQIGARNPNLTDALPLDAPRGATCHRGWLTFEVAKGAHLASIDYAPYEGRSLTWEIR